MTHTSGFRRIAIGVTLAATTIAALAVTGTIPGTKPTPRQAATIGGAWLTPDDSLNANPEELLAAAAGRVGVQQAGATTYRVVSVTATPAGPDVTVETTTSPATAVSLIRDTQEDKDALSVSLDTPVKLAAQPGGAAAFDPYQCAGQPNWAANQLDAKTAHRGSRGAGAVVAVIDTGVDARHSDLAGQVMTGAAFLNGTATSSGPGSVDGHSHGTHVAGIIAALDNGRGITGLAPEAKILPVRVLDSTGSGWNSDVAAGIIYAANAGAHVINMSLGGSADKATERAVEYAVSKGVVIVAAAGNERLEGNPVTYPAAYPNVIGVGAVDCNNSVAWFSNSGAYVDVAAPGVNINSTVPAEIVRTGYAYKDGTSMASPFVAAEAALLLGAGQAATAVPGLVAGNVTDLGAKGRDNTYGHGLIRPKVAVCSVVACQAATPKPDPQPAPTPTPDPQPTPTPVVTPKATRFAAPPRANYVWAGGRVHVRNRLLYTNGKPAAGVVVRIRAIRNGKVVSNHAVRTNRNGYAARFFYPWRNTTYVFTFAGNKSMTAATAATHQARVLPRVGARYSRHRAVARVSPALRQVVVLQKWNPRSGRWVAQRRIRTGPNGWAIANRLPVGTWRMHVQAKPGVEDVYTAKWRTR